MIIEISDATTPKILAIQEISREVAFEKFSKIGDKVRKNAGNSMEQSRHRHGWLNREGENGQRIHYWSDSKKKNLGARTNPDGSLTNPVSMRNMIKSRLYEGSGKLIVGGKHKAFTPVLRRDGEIVGVRERQSGVGNKTMAIIHKLDTGERAYGHGWNVDGSYETESMDRFKRNGAEPKFKGRFFMLDGFSKSIPYMNSELEDGYKMTVGRAMNKQEPKLKYKRIKRVKTA